MKDVIVPTYYVVSRKLPSEHAFVVAQALSITPCLCAVFSDVFDAALARELAPEIVQANSDKDAHALAVLIAEEARRPVLVVGEAEFLDAVYSDGRREAVAHSC